MNTQKGNGAIARTRGKIPTQRPMTAKQLEKFFRRACEFRNAAEQAAKLEPSFRAISEAMHDLPMKVLALKDQRENDEAARKDKGQVLWTLYHPMPLPRSIFDEQKVVMRTPNRMIKGRDYYLDKPRTYFCNPEDSLSDLKREWQATDVAAVIARSEEAERQWKCRIEKEAA